MALVRIARSAETDLLEGYVFYERQQAGIGDYFLDSLYADIDALALERFPFAICYDLQDSIATVVAVLDCRQSPNAIARRLG